MSRPYTTKLIGYTYSEQQAFEMAAPYEMSYVYEDAATGKYMVYQLVYS